MNATSTTPKVSLLERLGLPLSHWIVPVSVTTSSLVCLAGGAWLKSPWLLGAGAVAFCVALNRWSNQRLKNDGGAAGRSSATSGGPSVEPPAPTTESARSPAAPADLSTLIVQMLERGRYALLLRPQLVGNLNDQQKAATREQFEDQMSLIPAGMVRLGESDEFEAKGGMLVEVEPAFLDRHLVTNREYQQFVEAGSYGDLSLWDEESLAALIDFVDETGVPGPAYWRDGGYPKGQDDYPIVGVSWYEAQAYARWVGKRLPGDAEWVKAAAWPVSTPGKPPWQRKYPWGEEMDTRRANVWGSGEEGPVPVTAYAGGVSSGGVHQLVGNVWEWTASEFGAWHPANQRFCSGAALRSLRGGAYDTYFPSHCMGGFQSGERPTSRQRNIGFRCAVSACDLAPMFDEPSDFSTGEVAAEEAVLI